MARAQKKGLIKIVAHDLRKFTKDKHKTVDDRPYGGGVGMVTKPDVVGSALRALNSKLRKRIILLTPQGKVFSQKTAKRLAKYNRLILISGRYEGFDERIRKMADEEISIGDYILTGGELPAMVIVDAVARLVPGVVGKQESLEEESFSRGLLEYPQYTRPEVVKFGNKKLRVPKVLLSGNHKKIAEWRHTQAMRNTIKRRPDLLKKSK